MGKAKYLTAPPATEKMPAGIPYILTNEAAERFAYYGMTSILVYYMTHYLMGPAGRPDVMGDEQAKAVFHTFKSATYFLPVLGAIIADVWLAKYRTIIYFSLLYCVGLFAIAADGTHAGLWIAIFLVAVGSGVIKPCVSANVGDQFGRKNQHLMSRIFGWFYFAINVGAAGSMFLCPWLQNKYDPRVAFAVPAVLMVVATLAFWMGRRKYVHVPPAGEGFVKECLSGEGLRILGRLGIVYAFVAMFWALFDQSQSAWVLQATKMDRQVFGIHLLPEQPQAFNPVLVLVMIPLFSYAVYPALSRLFRLTALRKIAIGLFVGAASFTVPAWIEAHISGGDVVKVSSRSRVPGLGPVQVLDGQTDSAGWSSSSAPTHKVPQELVIRLRERKSWPVTGVKIYPQTQFTVKEIVAILEDLRLWLLTETEEADEAVSTAGAVRRAQLLQAGISEVRAAAENARQQADKDTNTEEIEAAAVAAAKAAAQKILAQAEMDTTVLDEQKYAPEEISVYVGDFSDRLLPTLIAKLSADQRPTDAAEYAQANGWVHAGDLSIAAEEEIANIDFEPIPATHALIQIKSNHGALRVKVAEIEVLTDEAAGAGARAAVQKIWPNVAAIGYKPHISWQFIAYIVLTAAEIMVSITCLEFAYTQSPKKMKSFVQSFYLVSIAAGNLFAAAVNWAIARPDGTSRLQGAAYYWFFTVAMAVVAVLFIFAARGYKERHYIQDQGEGDK